MPADGQRGGGGTTKSSLLTDAINWATDQNSLRDLVNAVIENNVFTRSAGAVVSKLRYATYSPPMFAKPGEESIED